MKAHPAVSCAFSRGTRVARVLLFVACVMRLAAVPGLSPAAAAPERVVSLAPNLTEIVCAVGGMDELVGRTSACDYPPDLLKKVPVIGGFGAPSLELLLQQRPTIVLDVALEDEALGRRMESLGLPRRRIPCRSLGDISAASRALGRLLHREPAAEPLAAQFEAGVARCRQEAAARAARHAPPKVYAEIWSDPLMTCGRRTFVAELIALAGGKNIGDEINREYFSVSPEWILVRQPDVILGLYNASAATLPGQIRARSGWSRMPAVAQGRIFSGLDNALLLRPGPRALEGVEVLRKCLERVTPGQPID